jgi:acyl-CoA synthetase (AMP-forming)/AMP-acid ligase II
VVDAAGRTADDRQEGRIEFRGASVTQGYYRNPEATALVRHDDWLISGDLGYWADGDLFITGREKDVVIQAGRNISAPEVEEIVSAIPGVRRGCVAAFGVQDEGVGTERLVVVAESRVSDADARDGLRRAIVEQLVSELGAPPDTVVVTGPGAVLKTSSGKVRRSATRAAFVAGTLGHRDPWARQALALLYRGCANHWHSSLCYSSGESHRYEYHRNPFAQGRYAHSQALTCARYNAV